MKCKVCGQDAKLFLLFVETRIKKILFLTIKTNTKVYYCFEHLLEEFRKEFIQYPGNLVVFYPDFETKDNIEYAYLSLDEMKKHKDLGYTAFVEKVIKFIKGKTCEICNYSANIAYYDKNVLKWKTYDLVHWEEPLIDEVKDNPRVLCAKCCYRLIEKSLKKFPVDYLPGLIAPYGESGIYFPRLY